MPFEPGNRDWASARAFSGALRRAIAQDNGARLRQAAEKLLTLAAEGEQWAVKELADRLDGKAHQSVTVEKKDVQNLSLSELAAEMAAAIAGGGAAPDSGAEQPSGLH